MKISLGRSASADAFRSATGSSVLGGKHQATEDDGDDVERGEERHLEGEIGEVSPLLLEGVAEAHIDNGDGDPLDESEDTGDLFGPRQVS